MIGRDGVEPAGPGPVAPVPATVAGGACVLIARVIHVPRDPFNEGSGALEAWDRGAVAVAADGRIDDVGDASDVRSRHPDRPVVDRRHAIVLPGFVDAHIHYPQVGVIGAFGLPLLRWLDERTFPFESRFLDPVFAEREARTFLGLLAANGTTSALVFGAHVPSAMEAFFAVAETTGLRVASGLVVSDHGVPAVLRTTAERAYGDAAALARRWHGRGRLRYAVSPRFAVTCGDGVLAACGALSRERPELLVTSHLNECRAEIASVRASFADDRDYLAVYERHGLVGPRSVFAHDVHPSDDELARLSAAGASVAHCPTSNAFLGSGAFPFGRHRRARVRVALGTDVGAGTSPNPLHEALQAYLTQAGLGADGEPLTAAHLLWLITRAGADAIGLGDEVGDLSPGRAADLVLIEPPRGSSLAAVLEHAEGPDAVLGACLALAREGAVAETWVQGAPVHRRGEPGLVA